MLGPIKANRHPKPCAHMNSASDARCQLLLEETDEPDLLKPHVQHQQQPRGKRNDATEKLMNVNVSGFFIHMAKPMISK